MPASVGTKGRIPRFRFKIGGLKDVFASVDYTKAKTTHEYEAATLYDNIDSNILGGIDYRPEVGLLTIQPVSIPENTRLVGAVTNNLSESTAFETAILDAQKAIISKHPSDVEFDKNYYTTYWNLSPRARNIYADGKGIAIYTKDTSKDSKENYIESVLNDFCSIINYAPDVNGVNKYNSLVLDTTSGLNLPYSANKGLYFNFMVGNSKVTPETINPCERIVSDDYGMTIESNQNVTITQKHICIEIGTDTVYRKFLLLEDGDVPTFVTEYIDGNVEYTIESGTSTINFPESTNFYVKITPYLNCLLIESDLFVEPLKVYVDGQPNAEKSLYDCMGAGLKVNFAGFSVFSFACGQTKYYTVADLIDNTRTSALLTCVSTYRLQEYDISKDIKRIARVYGNSEFCKYYLQITSPIETYNDKTPVHTDTTLKFAWDLGLYTINPFLTPYVYKVIVGQDITYVPPTLDTAEWQYSFQVQNLDISTSAEGLTKLTKTGSISFSNKKTYIDGYIPPSLTAIDWTVVNQRAIKIEFAYVTVDDTCEFPELVEADWKPLFTGFITDPSIKKDKYGDSIVTFQLSDRWMQIEDCKVTWSRIYDGVKQIEAILDVLRESGIYAPKTYAEYVTSYNALHYNTYDVVISSDPMVTSFVLPLNPNAWVNPVYKPKIKTSAKAFLDTLCEISNLVVFFDADGKFNIKHLREITGSFAANNYTVFADYILPASACPNNSAMMMPPWNNIQSPVFNRDVKDGLYNTVFVFGPNEVPNTIAVDWAVAIDKNSISNTGVTNYVGYKKILFKAMIAYGSKAVREIMAHLYLAEASHPQEVYNWKSSGNLLPLFSYVNFRENHIKTGVNENSVYFLIKNNFSFNAADLTCSSEMEAKRLKGLFQLYGIVE